MSRADRNGIWSFLNGQLRELKKAAKETEERLKNFEIFNRYTEEEKCRFVLRYFPQKITQLQTSERNFIHFLEQQAQPQSFSEPAVENEEVENPILDAVTHDKGSADLELLLWDCTKKLLPLLKDKQMLQSSQQPAQVFGNSLEQNSTQNAQNPSDLDDSLNKELCEAEVELLDAEIEALKEILKQKEGANCDCNLLEIFSVFKPRERKRSLSPASDSEGIPPAKRQNTRSSSPSHRLFPSSSETLPRGDDSGSELSDLECPSTPVP